MISDDRKVERLIQVAEMYYKQDMNQSDIAKRLGISRPLVSVLLNEARQRGIVTITINHAENAQQLLREQLEKRFGLAEAVLVEDQKNAESTDDLLARRAYNYCFESCQGLNVGIGWGSIMGRMADFVETTEHKPETRGTVFPMIGGIGASYRGYHPNEIARILSMHTGLKADYLYQPAFFDSEEDLKLAMRMESFQDFRKHWDAMDIALVSVSNASSYPDLGVAYRFGGNLGREGAVGRILAYYYDLSGHLMVPKVDNVMQIPMEKLKNAKKTIGVCSALSQPGSILGALAMGIIDAMILPVSLAKQLV